VTTRRLLTVGHSYAVALNRRLADEMARAGGGRWDVLAVGPKWVRGDLRTIEFEPSAPGGAPAEAVSVYFSRVPHIMLYGRRLREIVRGGRWDLVHCWQEPYVLSGGQIMWWAGRTPTVFTTYQNLSKRYPPPFNWVERYCVRKAAGWVTGAVTVRDTLLTRPGYADIPHALAPLGVDTDVFRPDPAAGAATRVRLGWEPGGPPVVGYLGRFTPEKGVALLMRVLDRVAAPWRALFVGGGPLEGELRTWAVRHGDRVRVVTGVPHAGVPAHLSAMDVLAAPSQTTDRWKEQLGRMLIEGFAAGLPVVGSDSGEIPHVIADAGAVVPEADEAAWASTIAGLLESPARRADLAARGLARAHDRFAWPVVARRQVEFFESVLAGRTP
jgi:glycosyltransferase involved in cell wall biosynthesis